MSTPAQIMAASAALLNDTEQSVYTNAAQLPYFNIALKELQEHFELNNIPVTKRTSAAITVVAGVVEIGFLTVPALPIDLIDLSQVWERVSGVDPYTPMTKLEYLPHYLEGTTSNQFLFYVWEDQKIKVLPASGNNDLKLDYIAYLFTTVAIGDINTNIAVVNTDLFLQYRTAGLCARFIGENATRATELDTFAEMAIERSTGISTKGRQSIAIRRKPFRAAWKSSGQF